MELKDSFRTFVLGLVIAMFLAVGRAAREPLMSPRIGEYASHIISVAVLICFILVLTYLLVRDLKHKYRSKGFRRVRRDLRFFGVLWLDMSFVAEIAQHYFMQDPLKAYSWTDYNIFRGRLMALVLLTAGIAPYLYGTVMLRRRARRSRHGRM